MLAVEQTLQSARGHLRSGNHSQAERACSLVLQEDPENVDAWHCLGESCHKQGKLSEALASFQQLQRLRPNRAEWHNRVGVLLAELGQYEEALACYRQALRLQPDLAEVHYNLGNALAEQGRVEQALASY